jgi:hypothetical protein
MLQVCDGEEGILIFEKHGRSCSITLCRAQAGGEGQTGWAPVGGLKTSHHQDCLPVLFPKSVLNTRKSAEKAVL